MWKPLHAAFCAHNVASRYGFITLATRQILAYFQRSSFVHLRWRRQIPKRLDGHVQTDLVAVLEAIGY